MEQQKEVEWIANPEKRTLMLKFNSQSLWTKFQENFGEFLYNERIDEWADFANCDCEEGEDDC